MPPLGWGIVTSITPDDVEHLATLARLNLTDAERDHFADQLTAIVDAVARVSEVVAEDIAPMSHPIPITNVTRPDDVTAGLTVGEALDQAPAVEDGRFRVPRILDDL
jgi:aspartyl-tRNA(Asn)/glutamyl-tRNA(Gln) amidotransferase subunit C